MLVGRTRESEDGFDAWAKTGGFLLLLIWFVAEIVVLTLYEKIVTCLPVHRTFKQIGEKHCASYYLESDAVSPVRPTASLSISLLYISPSTTQLKNLSC